MNLLAFAARGVALARAAGILAALLGTLGLLGWILGVPALKGILPGLATMKANTALLLLLEGAALAILASPAPTPAARLAARAAASLALAVGALTLGETLFNLNFGIDELLFRDPPADALPYIPGRMAPTTALCGVLVGIGLLIIHSPSRAADLPALAALVVAFLSLLGYLFGVHPSTAVTRHTTQMAIHTSLAFLFVATGLVWARARHGILSIVLADDAGGHAARRLLPASMFVPVAAGALALAGQRAGWYDTEFAIALVVAFSVVILSTIIWSSALSTGAIDALRLEAVQDARQANAELERRVAERTAELAAANRELEAFCYSVSHDLSAPLQTIDGFSRAIEEDAGKSLDPASLDHLARVRAAVARMAQIIDDLLDLSRLARAEMKRETVDVSAIASAIAADFQAREPARPVAVSIQPGLTAHGDARLIRIALENLFSNAWKFTAKQPHPRIDFTRSDDEFCLRDNGAGFDMQHAARLFGAFQRLHRDTEFPGTGIGLATVQRIVQRHGGKIRAEASPGAGAAFYFRL